MADDAASEDSQRSKRRRLDDSRLAHSNVDVLSQSDFGNSKHMARKKSGTPRGSGGSAKGSPDKAEEAVSYRRKKVDARSENVS